MARDWRCALDTSLHRWPDACRVETATLLQLMAEVDDPALQSHVMRLCIGVANANYQVTEGETMVLSAALDQWSRSGGSFTARAAL